MKSIRPQTIKGKNSKGRRIWILVAMVIVLVAGGVGYFFWNQAAAVKAAAAADSGYKTTQVKTGSITISVSGSGTLTAGKENNLSFPAAGTLARVNVQVGDLVQKGDVLAELAELDELQASVNSAQQDLVTTQSELDTLKEGAAAALANAQLTLADKKKAVTDAKSKVVQPGWTRCDAETTQAYYDKWVRARDYLKSLGDGGGSQDYYLKILVPQKNIVAQDYAAYTYCAGYTEYEISSSSADLALAQAELTQAQTTLGTLTKNNGLDPLTLATAENKVSTAQIALDKAREKLAGATMTAPFDGTILSVAGNAGDSVGTDTFITIADLAHPQVAFSVDETDLSKLAVGEEAEVSFDAIAGRTFKGKVTRINPALETSNGYQVATGLIELDLSRETDLPAMPKGMAATVTLVQAAARDVAVVPLQALHDLGDGSYSVFVVGSDGQLKMKVVEVGLQDAASAEVKSGLSVGDVVSTGTVQTK